MNDKEVSLQDVHGLLSQYSRVTGFLSVKHFNPFITETTSTSFALRYFYFEFAGWCYTTSER